MHELAPTERLSLTLAELADVRGGIADMVTLAIDVGVPLATSVALFTWAGSKALRSL